MITDIDCVDDPNGYGGYECKSNKDYCNVEWYDKVWYEQFRAFCRKTCKNCQSKQFKI